MFTSNNLQPHHFTNTAVIHDVPALNQFNPNESPATARSPMSNGVPHVADIFSNSKRLQDDLEKIGSKVKQHEENLKFLKTHKNQLEESILDMQVALAKHVSLTATTTEKEDSSSNARHEEETVDQILRHEKSAASVLYQLKIRHGSQTSDLQLTQDVVGIVAMLGKLDDDNLSRLMSEYLGLDNMLAIVCKSYEGVKALEVYDDEGSVNKGLGIHGLGASIGRKLDGRFFSICLESLRPYAGEFVLDDSQRRLNIPKPRLPSGDCPPGFLGYAVNMIKIDTSYLYFLTSRGYGLRETLFYNLFSRLQVYRTRAEMLHALPCISDGAVSLDGGIMRKTGVFALGSREEIGVRFAKCSQKSDLVDNYYEMEKHVKQKQWEKERIQEDMQREHALLEQAKFNFQMKRQEFLKFLTKSSSSAYMTQQQQMQAATQLKQSPQ